MESLHRSLNFELPNELNLDKYAQQILESSKTIVPATPIIPNATVVATATAAAQQITSTDILQKIGATLLNSIQLKKFIKIDNSPVVSSTPNMDLVGVPVPNHVVIDSSGFDAMDELQRQLEYDKFMNEVWIGIVLTLILISMVFCICSCFLYHQFRTWKRNYRSTVAHTLNTQDSEIVKLHPEFEDPVPEYTLVSGLPSYEAALQLLNKTSQSCLIVHPSVFNVFRQNEKATSDVAVHTAEQQQQQQIQPQLVEVTTPLLQVPTISSSTAALTAFAALPSYAEANNQLLANVTTLTALNEKSTTTTTLATPLTIERARNKSNTTLATSTAAAGAISNTTIDVDRFTQKESPFPLTPVERNS